MNYNLTQKLISRFPYIRTKANIGLQWGCVCDCGDGWYNLIYELFEKIESMYKTKNISLDKFTVVQIKEKYGELRVYTTTNLQEVHRLIDKYERLSSSICEECGGKGVLHSKHGYLKTLCGECGIKQGYTKINRKVKEINKGIIPL